MCVCARALIALIDCWSLTKSRAVGSGKALEQINVFIYTSVYININVVQLDGYHRIYKIMEMFYKIMTATGTSEFVRNQPL